MSQTLTITAEQVLASAERIREDIVRDRRTLHAAPEVGTDLPNTVACVKKRLLEMGYQPRELAGGVVAEITGTETGRCLLLRADMDALCVTEQTGLDFASANGCMHACGHDMHAAMLLGAAKLLREYQGELNGTVKLVFQPDEEGFTGNDTENERLKAVQAIADAEGAMVLPICAKLEEDIAGMDAEEKEMFLSELGLHESGLDRLIKVCYDLLGLMSYLTAGEQEVRAWTIEKGTKAPQAAGKIHTDFERGFIRAEVINYKDLIELGSLAAAREKGLVRSEGKEYVMQDGDVVLFRFNV